MNLASVISQLLISATFPIASYMMVKMLIFDRQIDHEKEMNRQAKVILSFIWGTSLIVNFSILIVNRNILISASALSVVFVTSIIAYSDVLVGRIPAFILVLGIVVGVFIGELGSGVGAHILGGVINILLGILMFYGGQRYLQKKTIEEDEQHAFGWGDVYASGSLGFLLGVPIGLVSFLLALILAIIGVFITSTITKQRRFLKSRVRLGIYFFLSAVAAILYKYLV